MFVCHSISIFLSDVEDVRHQELSESILQSNFSSLRWERVTEILDH